MDTPNIPLLRKYVEWVEEQALLPVRERDWNQGVWFQDVAYTAHEQVRDEHGRFTKEFREINVCGTSYCVAGRTALDAGYRLSPGGCIVGTPPGMEEDKELPVSVVAAKILGLSEDHASALFAGQNSAQRIRALAERFAGEKL